MRQGHEEAGDDRMDEEKAMECIRHIRAAAKLCEDAGQFALWATLLGVSDQLLEKIDASSGARD